MALLDCLLQAGYTRSEAKVLMDRTGDLVQEGQTLEDSFRQNLVPQLEKELLGDWNSVRNQLGLDEVSLGEQQAEPMSLNERRQETPATMSEQTAGFFSSFGDIIDPTLADVQQDLSVNPTEDELLAARNRMMEIDDDATKAAATRLPTKAPDFVTEPTAKDLAIEKEFNKHKGAFGLHIEASIPTFKDSQIKKARALSEIMQDGEVMYDLGGSEGSLIKSIAANSDADAEYINLDASNSMKDTFDKTPVDKTRFVAEAFGEGFQDGDVEYVAHKPEKKADVVHESMLFQFISPNREEHIQEIADNYMKDDGILILEEKLFNENWEANEKNKNENWKPQHFSAEDIALKEKQIGVTGAKIVESVDSTGKKVQSPENITGMNAGVISDNELRAMLEDKFQYVEEYWDGGNFKGYVATNSQQKIKSFMDALGGPIKSEYSNQAINDQKGQSAKGPVKQKVFVTEQGTFVEPVSAKRYAAAMEEALSKREEDGAQVDLVTEEIGKKIIDDGGVLFLAENDEFGGYVKADGYMGGLFKDPDSEERGVARQLQDMRIEVGGTHFDAYGVNSETKKGPKLEKMYINNGFVPVARMSFNPEYAPQNWQEGTLADRPDVVFFAYDPESAKKAKLGDGVVVEDYDQGLAMARDMGNKKRDEGVTIEDQKPKKKTAGQKKAAIRQELSDEAGRFGAAINKATAEFALGSTGVKNTIGTRLIDNNKLVKAMDKLEGDNREKRAKVLLDALSKPRRLPKLISARVEELMGESVKDFRKRMLALDKKWQNLNKIQRQERMKAQLEKRQKELRIKDAGLDKDGRLLLKKADIEDIRVKVGLDIPENNVKHVNQLIDESRKYMSTPRENFVRETKIVHEILQGSNVMDMDAKMIALRRAIDNMDKTLDFLLAERKKHASSAGVLASWNVRDLDTKIKDLQQTIHHYTLAYNKIGTVAGRILRFRQERLRSDFYSPARLKELMVMAKNGEKLTDAEKEFIKQKSQELKTLQSEIDTLNAENHLKSESVMESVARKEIGDLKKKLRRGRKRSKYTASEAIAKLKNTLKNGPC